MARGDHLARQWRIIQTLVSSKHGKTVAELVKEENCHPRTIYRDLEALQAAGFPIYSDASPESGGPASQVRGSVLVTRDPGLGAEI